VDVHGPFPFSSGVGHRRGSGDRMGWFDRLIGGTRPSLRRPGGRCRSSAEWDALTVERLSSLDLAFLSMDSADRPMHMGALLQFSSPDAVSPTRIATLLAARADRIDRLRLRPRTLLWPPGSAAWSPDPDFAVARHVFIHSARRAGDVTQLVARVAEVISQPLPASRPPWQLHVFPTVHPANGFALLVKLHHALADGEGVLAVCGGLLDELAKTKPDTAPCPPTAPSTPPPSGLDRLTALATQMPQWLAGAVTDQVVGAARGVATTATGLPRAAAIAATVTANARPTRMISAHAGLHGFSSPHRRATLMRLDADVLRRVGKQHSATMNEVILSVVTGGLRRWLLDDGELGPGATVRVLVPVSLRRHRGNPLAHGNHLSGYLVELPVGEPDPLRRLHQVRDTMARHKAGGPYRGPGAFPVLADWLPAAFHRLAIRPIAQAAPLLFDSTVTTVPLPDVPLHIGGAALHEIYPLVPIAPNHGLSVAIATYRGGVHVGLLTDPGVQHSDRLAAALAAAPAELRDADPATAEEPATAAPSGQDPQDAA
jgi:diacylglycerol O-acyltransferase / wax synthase